MSSGLIIAFSLCDEQTYPRDGLATELGGEQVAVSFASNAVGYLVSKC